MTSQATPASGEPARGSGWRVGHDGRPGCTVVVCRGARCRRAPVAAGQVLEALREPIRRSAGGVLIGALGCIGPCGSGGGGRGIAAGPAVVVAIRGRGIAAGAAERAEPAEPAERGTASSAAASPTVWVAVTDTSIVGRVGNWVAAGGPGLAPMPAEVDAAVIAIT